MGLTLARQRESSSTRVVREGHLCPTAFAGCGMANAEKKTTNQTKPKTNTQGSTLGDGENSKGCRNVCRDRPRGGRGRDKPCQDIPSLARCSQNESLLLAPSPASGTDLSPPATGALGQGAPGRAVPAGLWKGERRARGALPPPCSSGAPASISSFARDRPWCCRSMQINAKLIRVINSAVPQRSYRQGFR